MERTIEFSVPLTGNIFFKEQHQEDLMSTATLRIEEINGRLESLRRHL
jgi:hypothetical protein